MKKIVYIFITIIAISCSSTRNLEGIVIYGIEGVGEMYPSYIILKGGALKQFDFFSYSYGSVGNYTVKEDTLYVLSLYNYYSKSVFFDTLDIKPQKFLIKKDCLIDVTDYSLDVINNATDSIINDFLKSMSGNVYKKLKTNGFYK